MEQGSGEETRVFLSYRRDDCAMHAGRLADNLSDRGVAKVFLDVEAILPGQNFVESINEEIAGCHLILVMIGDEWLSLETAQGKPRISDLRDWVYLEVKAALERDVPVIPILVEGAEMPPPEELPKAIRPLAELMAVTMREESWNQDYASLVAKLPDAMAYRPGAPVAGEAGEVRKARASIDFVAAGSFVESIPPGHWASFADVAVAGGAPASVDAVAQWLRNREMQVPNVWRVLSDRGEVAEDWQPRDPSLPPTPDDVRALLHREGVVFDHLGNASETARWSQGDAAESGAAIKEEPVTSGRAKRARSGGDTLIVAGRRAYPDYLLSSSYICQQGRSFRNEVERLGFYSERTIKPQIPAIIDRRDNIEISEAAAARLEARDGEHDGRYAALIRRCLDPHEPWATQRTPGAVHQFFLLSEPDARETVQLAEPIWHDGASAWVQSQRYVDLRRLQAASGTGDL